METLPKINCLHLGRKISRICELRGMKQDYLTTEVIKNYSDKAIFTSINNFYDNSISQGQQIGSHNICNFNPLDELIKAPNANKESYERLLASEKEKVELLKSK